MGVEELQEERFQSMIAVPLLDREGEAIGVVALHAEAPREFGQEVVDSLVHVASLVAGAVDSARLVEAGHRRHRPRARRVVELAVDEHDG